MPRRLDWKPLIAALSLCASLAAAEVALRIIRPLSTALEHQPLIYRADPLIGYGHVAYARDYIERHEYRVPIQTNNAGFYDDDFSAERAPETRLRIAAIGDSFTEGFHVGRGLNYPDRLETILNEASASCPCEVLNFGISGTGTLHQQAMLEHVALAYQPDIVLVGFFENDVEDVQFGMVHRETYRGFMVAYQTESQRERAHRDVDSKLARGGDLVMWALQRSYLMRALYQSGLERQWPGLITNRASTSTTPHISTDEATVQIAEAVMQMQQQCEAAGCTLIWVLIPGRNDISPDGTPLGQPIMEELDRRSVRTLSLVEVVRREMDAGERLYWRYDAHFNAAGYSVVALEVAEYLMREGLIEQ